MRSRVNEIVIKEEEDFITVNGNRIYVNRELRRCILEEHSQNPGKSAIQQFADAKKLPGLVCTVGLPDFHIGYALPIGSIAVVDLSDPTASISPDGVGFDINCGVRCLRTNIKVEDIIQSGDGDLRERIADRLVQLMPFETVPLAERESMDDLRGILDGGMRYLLEKGRVTARDVEMTESNGAQEGDSTLVSQKSKGRGQAQLGTLGAGNHYLEIEVVDQICDEEIARGLGLEMGQIVVSIHTGSRGLGHGCCKEIMEEMKDEKDGAGRLSKEELKERYRKVTENTGLTKEEKIEEYSRIRAEQQHRKREARHKTEVLEHVEFRSELGQKYYKVMNTASNYAWANRSLITEKVRRVLSEEIPGACLDMVYDVCHNVGKVERIGDRDLLVLRKGASRILPPGHPELPTAYQKLGQPVLVGGSMGTSSYVVAGAPGAAQTYFSTCHGAGRKVSRARSKEEFTVEQVKAEMARRDIYFRVGNEAGMTEECGGCYKDVEEVVRHSEKAGVSKTVCRAKPILVLKG